MKRLLPFILVATNCLMARAFTEREVVILNPVDSIVLNGTVSIPATKPKALVVMATGSGTQDRDETVFGFKPFKVIAESLADAGYAVLRMDDRGFGVEQPSPSITGATTDDLAGDIAAGVEFLRNEFPSVPAGVIGHSEGGTIAIKLAAREHTPCDFIVTLAAPAWSGDSIVMSQSRAIATALTGKWEGEGLERRLLDVLKSPTPGIFKRISLFNEAERLLGSSMKIPEVQKSLSEQFEVMLSPHYIGMLLYDPSEDISAVSVPWLALNGDRDTQVLPANLDTIEELNPSCTTLLLPRHNHLFQHCDTGLPQEYPMLAEDISPAAVESIIGWLDSIFK